MIEQFTQGLALAMRFDTIALMSIGLFAGMLLT